MIDKVRPIVAAVHPNLINELRIRQKLLEDEMGTPIKGGLTIFSEVAAEELKYMRMSGQNLSNLLKSLNITPLRLDIKGEERLFIAHEEFKKFFRVATALNRKKDQNQIRLEIHKLKGLKKNEIRFPW